MFLVSHKITSNNELYIATNFLNINFVCLLIHNSCKIHNCPYYSLRRVVSFRHCWKEDPSIPKPLLLQHSRILILKSQNFFPFLYIFWAEFLYIRKWIWQKTFHFRLLVVFVFFWANSLKIIMVHYIPHKCC